MKKYLQGLLDGTPGLLAIVITDKDGVQIMKVCSKSNVELSQKSNYIAPFPSACDQAGKLGLGQNRAIVCFYDKFQIVSMSRGSVHIHLVGVPEGNTGDFMTIDEQLDHLMPDLQNLVMSVQAEA